MNATASPAAPIRDGRSYKAAMDALRRGHLTPDDFRAMVRESKAVNGEVAHERFKFVAIAASNR